MNIWFPDSAPILHKGKIEGDIHKKGLIFSSTSIIFYLPRKAIQEKTLTRGGATDFQIQSKGMERESRLLSNKMEKKERAEKTPLGEGIHTRESLSFLSKKTNQRESMRLPTKEISHL